MGKVLVLYYFASSNTAKMAELVAEGAVSIPGIEVRLRRLHVGGLEDRHNRQRQGIGGPFTPRVRAPSPGRSCGSQ